MLTITAKDGALRFEVRAKPRAKKSRVVSIDDGRLTLALAAPPVDGAANEALVALLADVLGLPLRAVCIVRGTSSRHKLVSVSGLGEADLVARITSALAGSPGG
ncbi:MAG TPA: DUF167 domain-containing protein [Polyangiaceae bacterium]|nr:DUF167 domain-containing protein [Polyangiaceae bacterium]